MKILLCTNNKHKVIEFKEMLSNYEIITPDDLHDKTDIEETSDTLEGNAFLKANYYATKYHMTCLSDDSGLLCEALDGKPGVYSARYAGIPSNSNKNRQKLIKDLENKDSRKAYFECVLCLIENDNTITYFSGKTFGSITEKEYGDTGFGYDSIFYSDDLHKTFGEANSEKDNVSHRGRAVKKLKKYLEEKYGK